MSTGTYGHTHQISHKQNCDEDPCVCGCKFKDWSVEQLENYINTLKKIVINKIHTQEVKSKKETDIMGVF